MGDLQSGLKQIRPLEDTLSAFDVIATEVKQESNVLTRLEILRRKLELDGNYVREDTVIAAIEEIKRLQDALTTPRYNSYDYFNNTLTRGKEYVNEYRWRAGMNIKKPGDTSVTHDNSFYYPILSGKVPATQEECVGAILECLCEQGGIPAWPGDGVSLVAQCMMKIIESKNVEADERINFISKILLGVIYEND